MDDEAVAQLALLENLLLNIIHRSPPQSSLLECKALKKKKEKKTTSRESIVTVH